MKKMILTVGLFVLALLPFHANAEKVQMSDPAAIYAVDFYADWCGSCQALKPILEKARGKADLDNHNVLFVTLDLTDATKRNQSALHASALGLGDFYKENNGKTGFVLLVNSKTKEIVGKLTKDMDANQVAATIKEKITAL